MNRVIKPIVASLPVDKTFCRSINQSASKMSSTKYFIRCFAICQSEDSSRERKKWAEFLFFSSSYCLHVSIKTTTTMMMMTNESETDAMYLIKSHNEYEEMKLFGFNHSFHKYKQIHDNYMHGAAARIN